MGFGGFGGFGGPFGGGRPGQPVTPGMKFAGIPPELQDSVDGLLKSEPAHSFPPVTFTQRPGESENAKLTLRSLILKYRMLAITSAALVLAVGLLTQVGPKLTELAINQGMLPQHQDLAKVAIYSGLFIAAIALNALSQWALVKTTGRIAASVMNDLRIRVFAHLQRLSLDFFTDEKAGVVMSRMTADIENLQQLIQDGLAQFAVQAISMVVITIIIFTLNVELALISVALVIPALTAMTIWFKDASTTGYEKVRDGIAGVLADLSESLHGIRIMVAFNRRAHNVVTHRNIVGRYKDANDYTAQINAVYGPGTQLLSVAAQATLLAIGGTMVSHRTLSIGALVAFFLYLGRFLQPIQLLVQQYNSYQQGQASVLKLRTLLETAPTVLESDDAVDLPPAVGSISFENVSFSYTPGTEVLTGITLAIMPGETVAFVGRTGAGKSTIAKLLTRFYDPTDGRVTIDGFDLRDLTMKSLRSQMGIVPQEPFLFAGTIRDNVSFACPDATEEEIMSAIDTVGLSDTIEKMTNGLDTQVQERGASLSSGERQLVSLARAFLAQPRILVLDEATSNLDLLSESKIEKALDAVLEGRTAVLIAHRLSTAMKADRIVVVDRGRVAESGSHDELMALGGLYSDMFGIWESQSASA